MMPEPDNEPNPFESPAESNQGSSAMPGATYFLFVASAAVTLLVVAGLIFIAPGISIIASLILVPANIRAYMHMRRKVKAAGHWPSSGDQVSILFLSMLLMIPILVAASIAFFAICWAGAYASLAIFPRWDDYGFTNMLAGGVPIGLLAGIAVYILGFRLTLKTASPDKPKSKESES